MPSPKRIALLSCVALLAACAGGTVQPVPVTPAGANASYAIAPDAALAKKHKPVTLSTEVQVLSAAALAAGSFAGSDAVLVSPAARAVAIQAANSRAAFFNVGPGARGCKKNDLGYLCRVDFTVPAFTNGITIKAFDRPLGKQGQASGKLLSSGVTRQEVRTKPIALRVVMNSYVGKVRIVALNTTPPSGRVVDLGLKLDVEDLDGFTIATGTYEETNGLEGGILPDIKTMPATSNFKFTVEHSKMGWISTPSDRYSLQYLGSGVISATVGFHFYGSYAYLATATIAPTLLSRAVPGSPHLDAGTEIVAPVEGTEWFTQTALGEIGVLADGVLSEQKLPSANTPTHIAFGSYNEPLVTIAFATQQNTVGTIDNQRDVDESSPAPGSAITGLSYDAWYKAPVFVQSGGVIGEYFGSILTLAVTGTPNLSSLVRPESEWAFADAGNDAVGLTSGLLPDNATYSEVPFPPGSGTPSFVAAGPGQSTWAGIAGIAAGAIVYAPGPVQFKAAAPLTSMTVAGSTYDADSLMAATDTNGDVEVFDASGKLVTTYHPPDGAASGIVTGPAQDLFYVCVTCANGVHRLIY
jgi:hypothetical protein